MRLAETLSAAITARLILGPEVEPLLWEILQTSGEFDRFEELELAMPDHLPVIYPPASTDARTFQKKWRTRLIASQSGEKIILPENYSRGRISGIGPKL